MPNSYQIIIVAIDEIHSLPGTWDNDALRAMLALAEADELGDIADADLLDMSLTVLQDLGNQKAGELVLEAVFGDSMRSCTGFTAANFKPASSEMPRVCLGA